MMMFFNSKIKNTWHDSMIYFVLIYINFVLSACGHKPEDPGQCRLNCGNALIGPIEGVIEAVHETQDLVCAPEAALTPVNDPIMFQFRMSESFQTDAGPKVVPLTSVSFEPIVNGLRSGLQEHNPNVEINGNVFSPARYKGILTPKSNWCSDSCGVATVEIVPLCPPVGETSGITIQVHSGGLYSEPYTSSISTASPD